jgi:hypothetical protein
MIAARRLAASGLVEFDSASLARLDDDDEANTTITLTPINPSQPMENP